MASEFLAQFENELSLWKEQQTLLDKLIAKTNQVYVDIKNFRDSYNMEDVNIASNDINTFDYTITDNNELNNVTYSTENTFDISSELSDSNTAFVSDFDVDAIDIDAIIESVNNDITL